MYTGFWITENTGNNAFSFAERQRILKRTPRLYVPPLVIEEKINIQPGDKVVFEEIDADGILRSVTGLRNFSASHLALDGRKVPLYVFDNHNHAFFFWHEALISGKISEQAKLIHIDAHTDLNEPPSYFPREKRKDLAAVFEYTNRVLNVGNFILPAIHSGCIDSEIVMINTEMTLAASHSEKNSARKNQALIVDIDLDFWNPELIDLTTEKGIGLTRQWLRKADVVTVATSPFFMPQARAFATLQKLLNDSNAA